MIEEKAIIKEFDLDRIKPNPMNQRVPEVGGSNIVVLGRSGQGKSVLIKSIFYAKKDIIPVAVVISPSEPVNKFYKNFVPDTFVYDEYTEENVTKALTRQKLAKDHLENPWSILCLDDCTVDSKIYNAGVQQKLHKIARHYKVLRINAQQYVHDLPKSIRGNVDFLFILRETILTNQKSIYESWATVIPSFALFQQVLRSVTQDYTALVIDSTATKEDWRDCVFWYKAKMIPDNFKFGCDDYWKFHETRYDPKAAARSLDI